MKGYWTEDDINFITSYVVIVWVGKEFCGTILFVMSVSSVICVRGD